ncbi:hypothetical protein ABVT39_014218 [Epinephelus coioides]
MEVREIITVIFIAINPSLTEDVKKYLTGTEGGSITFPDPMMVRGFVSFGGNILAMVENKNIEVYEELYKDRLLWDSDTGLLTITGLQRNDSGTYYIDSKEGNIFFSSYKLTVYESVPAPAVSTLSVSADGCTLLCFVKKAEEATLSWHKDEEILNQTGSVLSLPLTVHSQDFSFSYRCVAANPAENKTRPVNVTALCSDQNNTDSRSNMNTRQYSLSISEDRRSQVGLQTHPQGGNLPDSSGSADSSYLTTVYYKPL